MNHFLALTIGPVYKTLEKAKTTRELWVGSFFLSKLMELCIDYEPLKEYLLSPQKVDKPTYGAGVYPDRSYWKLDNPLTKEELTTHKSKILEKLSEACENMLSVKELDEYLKMYCVQASWTNEELGEITFLKRLNELLDGLELQNKWQFINQTDIITKLVAKGKFEDPKKRPIYKWRGESKQDITKYGSVGRVRSITEIATYPLSQIELHKDWYSENVTKKISESLAKLESNEKISNEEKRK